MSIHTEADLRTALEQYVPAPILRALEAKGVTFAVVPNMGFDAMLDLSPNIRTVANSYDSIEEARTAYLEQVGERTDTAGHYDPFEKRVVIVKGASPFVVAHEVAHAMDDLLLPKSPATVAVVEAATTLGGIDAPPPSNTWASWKLGYILETAHPGEEAKLNKLTAAVDAYASYVGIPDNEQDWTPADKARYDALPLVQERDARARLYFPTTYAGESPGEYFAESFALWTGAPIGHLYRKWINRDAIPATLIEVFNALADGMPLPNAALEDEADRRELALVEEGLAELQERTESLPQSIRAIAYRMGLIELTGELMERIKKDRKL